MSANSNRSAAAKSKLKILLHCCLAGLVLAVICWIVFVLAGRVLRHIAIAQITELTNTKIDVESMDFSFDGSVVIDGLRISPYQKLNAGDTILQAEKVFARFSIGSLLLLRPRLRQIFVNDFVFNAQRDMDKGRWNLSALKINVSKVNSGRIPVVRLERGILEYSKVSEGQTDVIAAMPVDFKLGPSKEALGRYNFDISTGKAGFGKGLFCGFWQPGRIKITGGIASKRPAGPGGNWQIDSLDGEFNYDSKNDYLLKLTVKDMESTNTLPPRVFELSAHSPLEKFAPFKALQKFYASYSPAGRLDIDLQASGNLSRLSESELRARLYCKDVRVCYGGFPYFVEQITGAIDITEKGLSLDNLTGRHGEVELSINGWAGDFGPGCKYDIRITSGNMAFDEDLYSALTVGQKKIWSNFSPAGIAAINYHLIGDSPQDGRKTLLVEPLNAQAAYRRFPYPLENLTGALLFDRDSITVSNVISQAAGRNITLNGTVTGRTSSRPTYDISVKATNIPLDSILKESLSPKQRRFYNRLVTTGLADAEVKIFTPEANTAPTCFTADVCLKDASLGLNQFPLAVYDVSAKTGITADCVRVDNLTGSLAGGSLFLTGEINLPQETNEPSYSLALTVEQLDLNKDSLCLLPKQMEDVLCKLQPKGKVNVRAELNSIGESPDYKVTMQCLEGNVTPELFPYPLKDITGTITVTQDGLTVTDIAAKGVEDGVNVPSLKLTGRSAFAGESLGDSKFAFSAEDVLLDEQFGAALPEVIQPLYQSLSPYGRVDLSLDNIETFTDESGTRCVDLGGGVRLNSCGLNVSCAITELDATVKTKVLYKVGEGLHSSLMSVFVENVRIKGESLTNLKADVSYDAAARRWRSENLVADCHGGKLAGKFELEKSGDKTLYTLQTGFEDINLKSFLSDVIENSKLKTQNVKRERLSTGVMDGSLNIKAQIGDNSTRVGRFRVQINDMQIGKLSPLAKLLIVLNLTEPGDYAFDQMVIDSYIRGDKLFLEKIDLSGEALAFSGSGWMDLHNNKVDLTLTARGRRLATAEPSVLASLTEELGGAVVRMKVTGEIYDPQVTTEALPVIKDSLGIFGTAP